MITNNTLNSDTFFHGEMDPISLIIMNREVLLLFSVFVGSTVPGRGIPHLWLSIKSPLSLKGFLTWVFLTQVEGLSTDGVTTVQIVKPSGANYACDFDHKFT